MRKYSKLQKKQPEVNAKLPLIDKITYGPLKKYKIYGRFPWKMIMHIALTFFVTAQIVLIVDTSGGYSRSEMLNFYRMFIDNEMDIGGQDLDTRRYFDNITEVTEFVNRCIETYYSIEDSEKLEKYYIPTHFNQTSKKIEKVHISLDTFYHKGHSRTKEQSLSYLITEKDRGPFAYNRTQFRDFLSNTTHFQLIYRLDNTIPSLNVDTFDCYHWVIYQEFDFTQRNLLIASIQADRTFCDSEYSIQNFWPRYLWVHVSCLILSLICLTFNLKYIYDIFHSYNSIKDKYKKHKISTRRIYKQKLNKLKTHNKNYKLGRLGTVKYDINKSGSQHDSTFDFENKKHDEPSQELPRYSDVFKNKNDSSDSPISPRNENSNIESEIPSWDKLTLIDKARLFSYWVFAMIISNVFIFIGCCLMIFNTKDIHHKGDIAIGIGGMLTWITLLKYYENSGGYNIVLTTFQNSSSIVMMALMGILPLFIGFGLLGMTLFWRSKRFMSFGVSMFSLFSLMNGDIINESYLDLSTVDYFISQLYLYSFIAMSVLVIQNVFIAIITDGYQISKFVDKTDWLKKASNLPEKNEISTSFDKVAMRATNSSAKVTDASPFAKLTKTKKRDERSKHELVKMLWHDKLTYVEQSQRQTIRAEFGNFHGTAYRILNLLI